MHVRQSHRHDHQGHHLLLFASHRGPASFNIGTPRAGSSKTNTNSNHPAPHYDDDLQDQAERVRDVSQGMFRAAFDRAQNNAGRNRQNLNAVHQQNAAGLLGAHNMLDPPNVTERRQEQYNFKRNPGGKDKQVNRDMAVSQQKEKRGIALNEKRVRNPPPSPPPHPLHPDDPHPQKINHPTIHDKNKANKNVLRGPYYQKGDFKKSSNY